jgi:hypothetical protein
MWSLLRREKAEKWMGVYRREVFDAIWDRVVEHTIGYVVSA